KTCNGCHTNSATSATPSHGRSRLTTSVNPGAPTAGQPFPDTNPAVLAGAAGDTMAAVLAASSCGSTSKSQSAATCTQVLSTDVIYTPGWTIGVTIPAGATDPIISYPYGVDS